MMESRTVKALKAKATAEKKFIQKDYVGAQNYAIKAQKFCPEMEGMSQMVTTFGVYVSSLSKINGELDFYSILGMDPSSDKPKLRKRYKKLAVMLHPDKNKNIGADGAFKLISEAWTLLSDSVKRSSYDQRRSLFVLYGTGGYNNSSKSTASRSRVDSFWTVCTSCHVQYEYLRKYVNKQLCCKNCRDVFVAVETGLAPTYSSFPYSSYSIAPENGYGAHGYTGKYMPTTTGCCTHNGIPGHDTGLSSCFSFYQTNGESNKRRANRGSPINKDAGHSGSNGFPGNGEASRLKCGRPSKKRKIDSGITFTRGQDELCPNIPVETKTANGNGSGNGMLNSKSKISHLSQTSARRSSVASAFDTRQMLIEKARSEIRRKLEDLMLVSEATAPDAGKRTEVDRHGEVAEVPGSVIASLQSELKRTVSTTITVPDSDFHNFDHDKSEECFKPKQIWALYDEEDGMPRLYCLIREVLSLNPFKINISYLISKPTNEYGNVSWSDPGFTKSCGSFRVFNSETVEQVNIFSHLLSRDRAGRGGCVKIYPRAGDIWAVYRNWSPDWNITTSYEVRHQYEMVEIIEDYSEEHGVSVAPLIKLDGFRTVYQRNTNSSTIRWISTREMLQFSHQVPSCSLSVEGTNLPEGCCDLDPAATPNEVLQLHTEVRHNLSPGPTGEASETAESDGLSTEKFGQI